MEWSRAKNILIWIFIVLNVYLFINFSLYFFSRGISQKTLENTTRILDNRGVTFAPGVTIPSYNKRTPMLEFTGSGCGVNETACRLLETENIFFPQEGGEVVKKGDRSVELNGFILKYSNEKPQERINTGSIADTEKQLRDFCRQSGIQEDEYILDSYLHGGQALKVLFIQKTGPFLVFDNYIKFTVENRGIAYMEYSCRKIKGLGRTSRGMEILPANLILLKAFPKNTGTGKVIESIDLGFKGYTSPDTKDKERIVSDSQSPVWRIITRGGLPRFFKAYDGEELE